MQFAVTKRKMTPEQPIFQAGFGARSRKSEGILDDLYIKAILLRQQQDLLILTLDALGADRGFVEGIKETLEEQFDLKPAQVLINFSHTHASIHLTGEKPEYRRGNYSIDQDQWPEDPESIDYTADIHNFRRIRTLIMEMVSQCYDQLQPGQLKIAIGQSDVAVSRRLMTETGLRWAPNFQVEIDKSLPVLTLTNLKGELKAILFNYGCHPTSMGSDNYLISAEYAGRACEMIERSHPDVIAAFMQGFSSDLKPAISADNGRFKPCSIQEMQKAGDDLAHDVNKVLREAEFTPVDGRFTALQSDVLLDTEVWEMSTIEAWAEQKGSFYIRCVERLKNMVKAGNARKTYSLSMMVWQLAPHVRLVAMESEIPTDYALRLRRMYPDQQLIIAGYSNGVYTYIPTEKMLEEGGYEAEHPLSIGFRGRFVKGTEETIFAEIDRLCKSISVS